MADDERKDKMEGNSQKQAHGFMSGSCNDWQGNATCLNIELCNFETLKSLIDEIVRDGAELAKKIALLKNYNFQFRFTVSESNEHRQS